MASLPKRFKKNLTTFMNKVTEVIGSPIVFFALTLLILIWFIVGIFFRYDETWFNILDVFVFMTTFFIVFVVQASQNADTEAIQEKLDEIINSLPRASDKMQQEEKRLKRGEKAKKSRSR